MASANLAMLMPTLQQIDKLYPFMLVKKTVGNSVKNPKIPVDIFTPFLATAKRKLEGVLALKMLCDTPGQFMEPYMLGLLQTVLNCAPLPKNSINDFGTSIIKKLNPFAVNRMLTILYFGMSSRNWQTKVESMTLVATVATTFPEQTSRQLPQLIQTFMRCLQDTKPEVVHTAQASFEAIIRATVKNPDIAPIVHQLTEAYADPVGKTVEVIGKLLETTFVSTVDAPTLGLLMPILRRGMTERKVIDKRKAAVIILNMCKLVVDPRDAAHFYPILEPVLMKNVQEVGFEEVKKICEDALDQLRQVKGDAEDIHELLMKPDEVRVALTEAIAKQAENACENYKEIFEHVLALCVALVEEDCVDEFKWALCTVPYLTVFMPKDKATTVANDVLAVCKDRLSKKTAEESAGAESLLDVDFSLAYGGKILLHNTKLSLKRGARYGLIGENGVGKTTLLRSISTRNLEGLPENLRTVYVQHDLDGSLAETSVLCYVETAGKEVNAAEKTVIETLKNTGFTEPMFEKPIASLSGGWKMKLALARAMVLNADLLLLDEPTNHLDQSAVAWLTKYLQSGLKHKTCIIVSHTPSFLNAVCTDIIHFDQLKLYPFHGNLNKFATTCTPAAKNLVVAALSDAMKFTFPVPGRMEGVNSRNKRILRMEKVNFTYPGATQQTITNATVNACMASRVAIIGPNGAGKSTLIKLLVGELMPAAGTVWRHHNLRIAYVAQHSFHHIEQHLDQSPVQYMLWRFHSGVDREALEKESNKLDETEAAMVGQSFGQVEKILARRTKGKDLEYLCSFVGRPERENRHISRAKLEEMGYLNLIRQADEIIAAEAAGIDTRPLTTKEIQLHFDSFGLPAEFGTHGKIRGLSGGQKVKLVLAAAMWNCPHIIILDEPTNYLDRNALGALSSAIKNFAGGVLIISHNAEFTKPLCSEQWLVDKGNLKTTGGLDSDIAKAEVVTEKKKEAAKEDTVEEMKDKAGGNTNAVKDGVKMTDFWGRPLSKKEMRAMKTRAGT